MKKKEKWNKEKKGKGKGKNLVNKKKGEKKFLEIFDLIKNLFLIKRIVVLLLK